MRLESLSLLIGPTSEILHRDGSQLPPFFVFLFRCPCKDTDEPLVFDLETLKMNSGNDSNAAKKLFYKDGPLQPLHTLKRLLESDDAKISLAKFGVENVDTPVCHAQVVKINAFCYLHSTKKSKECLKIVHSCSQLADVLQHVYDVKLQFVFDTASAWEQMSDEGSETVTCASFQPAAVFQKAFIAHQSPEPPKCHVLVGSQPCRRIHFVGPEATFLKIVKRYKPSLEARLKQGREEEKQGPRSRLGCRFSSDVQGMQELLTY